MPPTVFIETTIPSYYVARPSRNKLLSGHQALTRHWWDRQRHRFNLFTSELVLEEAAGGEPEKAAERLRLLVGVSLLTINETVTALANELVTGGILPAAAGRDAFHVAAAGFHGVKVLLTWNCKHLANPFLTDRLRTYFADAGFSLPILCTPEQLLAYDPAPADA